MQICGVDPVDIHASAADSLIAIKSVGPNWLPVAVGGEETRIDSWSWREDAGRGRDHGSFAENQ